MSIARLTVTRPFRAKKSQFLSYLESSNLQRVSCLEIIIITSIRILSLRLSYLHSTVIASMLIRIYQPWTLIEKAWLRISLWMPSLWIKCKNQLSMRAVFHSCRALEVVIGVDHREHWDWVLKLDLKVVDASLISHKRLKTRACFQKI